MKSKRIIPIVMACTLLGASAFFSAKAFQHVKEEKLIVANAFSDELDLTTVPFYNTPVAGYGNVNVNKNCEGGPLTVNGVTYAKGIGTHAFNDASSTEGDIQYDISAYSDQYEYFETKVGFVDGGDNCFKFTVLLDGVVKDFIYVRKGTSFGDDNPYILRCKIAGGSILTLRVQCTNWGYACGTCAFLEPKLYNVPEEKVYASDILDRYGATNGTGWSYLTGDGSLIYLYPMLDERVDGTQFTTINKWTQPYYYTKGIGTQLKDGNYDAYAADKTNPDAYAGMTFDIAGKGFSVFNANAIIDDRAGGAYVDAWADGVEIYHSELISPSEGGINVCVDIPAGTASFEVRIIANDGMGFGRVDLCGACFIKGSEYLYSYAAQEILAPEYKFPCIRGEGQIGKALTILDSASGTTIDSPRGLYIHKNGAYIFGADGLTYNRLTGSVGVYGPETGHGSNNLKAVFTYNDSTTIVKRTETFNLDNSNIPFSFDFDPTDLATISLELEGDLPCSSSVIHNAKFENRPALSAALEAVFAILQMDKWQGENARASGSCEDDFYDARALVLALGEEDLTLFKTSEDSYIAAGRARYEAWALALGEQAYADAKLSSNILFKQADMTTTMTVIIAASAVTCLAFLALALLRKKKRI